jgi:RNA-dependent RNA polymerase
MELFVRGVDFDCDYKAVDRAVARVLHTDPSYARFSSGGLPLNFGVYLFPKKGDRRRHRGFGTLTLPTAEVGRQFMRDYGAPSPARPLIRVGNRYLQFSHDPTRNEARRDILERITSRPYIDPAALEEDERRAELLDHKRVKLQLLQFGYECRDWVFSPELDVNCAGITASITFDQDSRALRIEHETDERWSMVMIRFSNISSHAAGLDAQGCPALFFSLIHPPQYNWEPRDNGPESDDPLSFLGMLRDLARDGQSGIVFSPKRFRATAFDASHKPIAPYCSHALRAVCSSSADLASFHELADAAGLVRATEYHPRIERRDLCLAGTMDQYRTWLKSLAWRVAFQLEVMTRSLWFTIPEVLRLQSRIEVTLRLRGRHFTVSLLKGIYEEISGGSQESVGQCYDRCRKDFIPPPRIDRQGDDLYDCFHVDVSGRACFLDHHCLTLTSR